MPENVQYEITSPAENVPMSAPNLRSTLNVPGERAMLTIDAVIRRDLRDVQAAEHPDAD